MATAHKTTDTVTDFAAMNMASLRKIAKEQGITVTSGVRKDALIKTLTGATLKASPVRKDVAPADVKPDTPADGTPDAHTPEETAEIQTLENLAGKFVEAGRTAAERLANTMVKLYGLKPWEGRKNGNGHPLSVAAYFSALGNRLVATDPDARKIVVKALAADLDNETLQDVTGASPRTVIRDKRDLGLARAENKAPEKPEGEDSDSKPAPKPPPTPPAVVTPPTVVLSMASVHEFINGLTDDSMLEELAELIAERRASLAPVAVAA